MVDAVHGNTELGATKQDLIAAVVQKELAFRAKLMPTITDVSRFAIAGSKTIEFPKLTSFTVINRTEGVAGDSSVLTASTDIMNLDFNAYVAWIIDSMTAKQSNIEAESVIAQRAAAALGRYVDTQIITELINVAALNINAGVPADITKDNVLDLIEQIDSSEGDLDDSVFIVPSDQRKALLKITDFSANDVFGRPVCL